MAWQIGSGFCGSSAVLIPSAGDGVHPAEDVNDENDDWREMPVAVKCNAGQKHREFQGNIDSGLLRVPFIPSRMIFTPG